MIEPNGIPMERNRFIMNPGRSTTHGQQTGVTAGREGPPYGSTPGVPVEPSPPNVPAWEMIEPGRYRPRRTRGSFPGRELG
jgi:hypothetical protein